MLPSALRTNRDVRREEMTHLAHVLFGPAVEAAPSTDPVDILIAEIDKLCDRAGVPRRLSQVGITQDQLPAIAQSSRGSSMRKNPRDVPNDELLEILEGLH